MQTKLVTSIHELRQTLAAATRDGRTVGLVPTMGALHRGHAALMQYARRESDVVVASVFVNPTQFNRSEDFEKYPRDVQADVEFCAAEQVDIVFAPGAEEMYPGPLDTFVEVTRVAEGLCGTFRPGHFRGVATVVMKLFNIVQPDRAYFGQKDAQQLAVVRKMVEDLNCPVTVVAVPTVREADGLALSSRNQHLISEERKIAPVLFRALQAAESKLRDGSVEEAREAALAVLRAEPLFRTEYLEIVNPEDMQPVRGVSGPVCIAAAAWLGSTRLIDNVLTSFRRDVLICGPGDKLTRDSDQGCHTSQARAES